MPVHSAKKNWSLKFESDIQLKITDRKIWKKNNIRHHSTFIGRITNWHIRGGPGPPKNVRTNTGQGLRDSTTTCGRYITNVTWLRLNGLDLNFLVYERTSGYKRYRSATVLVQQTRRVRNMTSVSSPRFSVLCTLLSMPCTTLCMPMLQPFTSESVPTEKYRLCS